MGDTSQMKVNGIVGRPLEDGDAAKPREYDAIFRDVRLGIRIEPQHGRSIVSHVEPGGQADSQGVDIGSVVVSIDSTKPTNSAHLVSMLKNGRRPMVIRFRRGTLQPPKPNSSMFGGLQKKLASKGNKNDISSHIGEIQKKKSAPVPKRSKGANEKNVQNFAVPESARIKAVANFRARKERERQQQTRLSGGGALLDKDYGGEVGRDAGYRDEGLDFAKGPTGGGADDSEYESILVNELCGAAGISRHPPQDKLEEFLPICSSLDVERVGHLIKEHLRSSHEKEKEKALHVVDLLCQTPGAEEYREYFCANHQEIMQLSNSKKRPLRQLASSILSELSIVGMADLLNIDEGGGGMHWEATAASTATPIDNGTSIFDMAYPTGDSLPSEKESTERCLSRLEGLSEATKRHLSMEGLSLFAFANSGTMPLAPDEMRVSQKAQLPDIHDDDGFGMIGSNDNDDFGMTGLATSVSRSQLASMPRSEATTYVGQGHHRDTDLSTFLQSLSLQKFEKALNELGVEAVTDFWDLEETDMDQIGMKVVHKRRLKKELDTLKKVLDATL